VPRGNPGGHALPVDPAGDAAWRLRGTHLRHGPGPGGCAVPCSGRGRPAVRRQLGRRGIGPSGRGGAQRPPAAALGRRRAPLRPAHRGAGQPVGGLSLRPRRADARRGPGASPRTPHL
jgi:hypothetical protein